MATGDDRVGLLFWEMTLDDKEFKSKIKDSKKRLEGLDKDSKGSLGKLAGRFTLIAGAVAAVGIGLAKFTADTVQAIAEQKILADSIGATTAEIAGLKIASQKLGLESSQVIDKMREFGGITEFKKLADGKYSAIYITYNEVGHTTESLFKRTSDDLDVNPKTADIAATAINVVKNKEVKFYPESWQNTYFEKLWFTRKIYQRCGWLQLKTR